MHDTQFLNPAPDNPVEGQMRRHKLMNASMLHRLQASFVLKGQLCSLKLTLISTNMILLCNEEKLSPHKKPPQQKIIAFNCPCVEEVFFPVTQSFSTLKTRHLPHLGVKYCLLTQLHLCCKSHS